MAGGRRCPGGRSSTRLQVGSSNSNNNNSGSVPSGNSNSNNAGCYNNVDDKRNHNNMNEQINVGRTLAPKHIPVPSVPFDGQIHFEALSLATSLVVAALQLLNLYKTIWWLPHSYNDYSMNFYLMDPYLLIFIITMAARQLVHAIICKSMDSVIPQKWLPFAQRVMRILLFTVVMGILLWCLYHMNQRHSTIKIFYLCYPSVSFYFLMFGFSIRPFFDISSPPLYVKEDRKTKFLLDKPLHNCSLNATAIRAEVASLQLDFNKRLKKALFASSGSAYLCGVAPVIFIPQHLHYDFGWVAQHVIFIWLGRLGTHLCQSYPVRYCDVLHRAALHLGKWSKFDSKNVHIPIQSWNDGILWPHGSVVRHNKELYRSEGLCTAAEPGNPTHHRFHAMFGNPSLFQFSLFVLELTIVVAQFMILFRAREWYRTLSMCLLLMTNYCTLYRLFRDYLVSYKLYHTEQIIQEKAQITMANNAQ
ncbi:transmembrane protein 39A [Copidosoma floridanum]|uniref:transmembrane protein 39A n=1 Tax=Copidosoma floridanum TaxID=29053 RepID=UPI0006C9BE39|nr:transmembrane protein 39A [Copidosoma floridanum]